MDPISIVVAALIAGLTAGVTDTVKNAVQDIYNDLKSKLEEKIGSDEEAKDALAKVQKQPESKARQELLKEELLRLGAEKDLELLTLSQKVLEKLDKEGAQAGKYIINIKHGQGIVIGEQIKVTQKFGQKKSSRK